MNKTEVLASIQRAVQDGVTKLDLANQAIEYLPPEIGRLSGLVQLDLDGNSFPNVPVEIGNLSRLEVLQLGGNHELKVIPQEVFNLPHLTDLTLPGFETAVSPQIGDLPSLEILGFVSGSLKTLPEEIANCTNLTELYVNFTLLEELPARIGELINLRKLHL
jgi:leucine-rich repeat protein SHOC2